MRRAEVGRVRDCKHLSRDRIARLRRAVDDARIAEEQRAQGDHGDRRLRKRWGCGWAGAGHVRMGSEES
eukprot:scaffold15864_cov101-Isochrysis_galbana.AAC.1